MTTTIQLRARNRVVTPNAIGFVCAIASSAAWAQQMDPHLAEVIVTANKREQRLQDVGAAVSVLQAERLATERINDVTDIGRIVPGLQVAPSLNNTPVYTLRGIGFYETSVAANPDVSIYVDEAPLPLSVMSKLAVFDLQRVEILKGPQGTLFGNNATGGAINFVTAKPASSFSAGADLDYGRFDTVAATGFITGPLADTLDARLALRAVDSDDWQQSYSRDDALGSTDQAAVRLMLAWHPLENLHVMFNANAWRDRSDPQAPQLARMTTAADLQAPVGTVGPTGSIGPDFPLLFYPPAPRASRAADWSPNNRPYADDRLGQLSMNVAYQLGPSLTFTSISNGIRFRMQNATEGDGTALNDLDITRDHADARSFTQEFRLAGNPSVWPMRWVLGVNYEKTHVDEAASLIDPDASTGAQQGFSADSYESDQVMKNLAVFANLEFDLGSRFTIKGGLRQTEADRSTSSGTYQTEGYVEPFPGSPGLVNLLNFVWAEIYTPSFCPGVSFTPLVATDSVSIDPVTCQTGRYRAELDQHNLSWSVGTDFKVNDDVLIYINGARGYKAGGFPLVSAATTDQYAAVTQESLLSYEAGVKVRLAPGRVALQANAFHYDYRDKQLRGKTVDPLFGLLDRLVNVPESSVDGAEVELSAVPIPRLNLRLAATYLDTEVDRYEGTIGTTRVNGLAFPVRAPFDGVELPFAPQFSGSASIDYSVPAGQALEAFAGMSVVAQSSSVASLQLSAQDVSDASIPGFATLNLRMGVGAADGNWQVSVWGTNVTNKYYWTNALRVYDTVVRYSGRPAEYGVSFSKRL